MADRPPVRAGLATVPIGWDFCDAVVDYLFEWCGTDHVALSQALVLLPNNRAVKAISEAFVRRASPGLLLPRLVAVGDLALDEKLGPLLDPIDTDADLKPLIDPIERLMLLTGLVAKIRPEVSAAEGLRLARELAGLIDEMEVEELPQDALFALQPDGDLSAHWSRAYRQLENILPVYRETLVSRGLSGPSELRNALLDRLSARLSAAPPATPVIAAGITTSAKAIARLLKCISLLPQGVVILPALDLEMAEESWSSLGPHGEDELAQAKRNQETHPQFHLKLLLERMGVGRSEFVNLRPPKPLSQSIADIFCLPEESSHWRDLSPSRKKLSQARLLEADDSAHEARAIATYIREVLETPGKLVALVTPDRELAIRVKEQLARWRIDVDDSAGLPLLQTPPGTLIMALADAYSDRFSPVSLLALLKHPLVHAGQERTTWLSWVRQLDLRLRGPSTGVGLDAISARVVDQPELAHWWMSVRDALMPVEGKGSKFTGTMQAVAEIADRLSGGAIWRGAAGRQLALLWEQFQQSDLAPLDGTEPLAFPSIVTEMLGNEVVRPPYGGHPRVAIYGLLEARLQRADIVICAGLNEGTWPQLNQQDPWLSPVVRRRLGLPALDRNIGLSAHDLSVALGAADILLTRARRDRGGPTVASRFLLRIKAFLASSLENADALGRYADALDMPEQSVPFATRPDPKPGSEQRKVRLSITDFDQLKSDPYSFYAKRVLRLRRLDPVASEPSYAWRGTLVHDILEKWFAEDGCDPAGLERRAGALLNDPALDPSLRTLWQPRVAAGLQWVASETARLQSEGRILQAAEVEGETEIGGMIVTGRADRIDKLADGSLAIVDYKTGVPPRAAQVSAGFALQLGLIGLMAERGQIKGVAGKATAFEYWSLAKNKQRGFGYIENPLSRREGDGRISAEDFVGFALRHAEAAIAEWINGDAPFNAKLHPQFANYDDFDQLMRLQEWDGRQPVNDVDEDTGL